MYLKSKHGVEVEKKAVIKKVSKEVKLILSVLKSQLIRDSTI